MANILLLKAKIVENNTTQEAIADAIGINRTTFYRKIKENGKGFTVEEVQRMVKILNLTAIEVMKIFFAA